MTGSKRSSKLILAAAAAVAGLLGLLAMATAEVVEKGRLLPYTPAEARRVRFFDAFELTFQIEPPNSLDALGAGLLLAIAGLVLLLAIALPRVGRTAGRDWFYGLVAVGTTYLALDEVLGFHETLGANLRFLGDLPGVNSPEDVVFLLYGIPALAFLVYYRDVLTESRLATWLIAIGIVLFGFAVALDVLDAILDEQWVELSSMAFLFGGFLTLGLRDLATAGVSRDAVADEQSRVLV